MEELTPEMNYRFTVIEAINSLTKTKQELFEKLANVAMAGEFGDIDKLFGEGERINFNNDTFKHCEDVNVGLLAVVMKAIIEVRENMIRNNNISDNELDISVTM